MIDWELPKEVPNIPTVSEVALYAINPVLQHWLAQLELEELPFQCLPAAWKLHGAVAVPVPWLGAQQSSIEHHRKCKEVDRDRSESLH